MLRRLHLWFWAGALALSAPVVGLAECNKPCPTPACSTPCAPRIVVEIPPAEVTFKQACPTCVKAPAGPCKSGDCGPSMVCFPFSVQVPSPAPLFGAQPLYYAPAPLMAAPMMAAPQPMMAAPGYAPAAAYPTYAAPGYAPAAAYPAYAAPAAAYPTYAAPPLAGGPAQAFAPSLCGSSGQAGLPPAGFGGGPGAQYGLAGVPSSELEAMAAGRKAYEQAAFRGQMDEIKRTQGALADRAAAYGVSFRNDDRKGQSDIGAAAPAASPVPGASDTVLQDVAKLKQDLAQLKLDVQQVQTIVVNHQKRLDEAKIPPVK